MNWFEVDFYKAAEGLPIIEMANGSVRFPDDADGGEVWGFPGSQRLDFEEFSLYGDDALLALRSAARRFSPEVGLFI